jgi:hypothetical protein
MLSTSLGSLRWAPMPTIRRGARDRRHERTHVGRGNAKDLRPSRQELLDVPLAAHSTVCRSALLEHCVADVGTDCERNPLAGRCFAASSLRPSAS